MGGRGRGGRREGGGEGSSTTEGSGDGLCRHATPCYLRPAGRLWQRLSSHTAQQPAAERGLRRPERLGSGTLLGALLPLPHLSIRAKVSRRASPAAVQAVDLNQLLAAAWSQQTSWALTTCINIGDVSRATSHINSRFDR